MDVKRNLLKIGVSVMVAFFLMIIGAQVTDKAVNVYSASTRNQNVTCIIIDAGHGGVDSGAVSNTGQYESQINLEIALKLNDLMQLLGYNTKMIRTRDISVYTKGETIAQKKVSDLKERVRITNSINNAILISIHQNYFHDSRYRGAQVFYSKNSIELAQLIQSRFVKTINPDSNRKVKKSDGIYLMENIQCPGVLIECGFLSNPMESINLNEPSYQRKLCCIIASAISCYTNSFAVT